MATLSLGHLPSLWKQHLLSEFAGLKQACPEGVFVSMNPGDAALWSAVLFVRDGPYATAVLRFNISFPDSYPRLPPLVTFQTDMFHPLITPLTTHMYATDLQIDALGSAAEQEMLPPGGFSLRHGFPQWFQRDRQQTSGNATSSTSSTSSTSKGSPSRSGQSTPVPQSPSPGSLPRYMQTERRSISTYSILKYIRTTFDTEDVLDSIPLSATGNPGAWHAWRTHRRKQGKVFTDDRATAAATPTATATKLDNADASRSIYEGQGPQQKQEQGQEQEQEEEQQQQQQQSPRPAREQKQQEQQQQHQEHKQAEEEKKKKSDEIVRRPEDWNWEGVWEDRVKKGIASTLTESVLYGAAGGSDSLIHFLALEDGDIQTVKDNLRRTLGVPV